MKARIQLIQSDQFDDATLYSRSNVLHVNKVSGYIDETGITYCEMLLVTKSCDIKNGDYCLINDHGAFIVEKCDKVVKPETVGVRNVFIGQAGTITVMDNVEKIIASTINDKFENMPRIHKVFIDKFVETYDSQDKITTVNVISDDNDQPIIVKSNNTVIITKVRKRNTSYNHNWENGVYPDETVEEVVEEDFVNEDANWVGGMLKAMWPDEIIEEVACEDSDEMLIAQTLSDLNVKLKVLDTYMNSVETSVVFKITIPNEFNENMIEKLAILKEMGVMK